MNFTVAVFKRRYVPSYVCEARLMMNSRSILPILFPLMAFINSYPIHRILH